MEMVKMGFGSDVLFQEIRNFEDYIWRWVSVPLALLSMWGVFWGYLVYYTYTDLGQIIRDLLTWNFNIRIFKLVTLDLCPLLYLIITVCLVIRILGLQWKLGEAFLILCGLTSGMSLMILGYILMVGWGLIDLFHTGFIPYTILLIYMGLQHTQVERKAIWLTLGILLAVIWLLLASIFNYWVAGWSFPRPF